MMIKINHNNIIYTINKEKLIFILSKLASKDIKESEITLLMKEYKLFDEYFLKTLNKI